MTDEERIKQLRNALISARYSICWWSKNPVYVYSTKRKRKLEKELAKYDEVINSSESLIGS